MTEHTKWKEDGVAGHARMIVDHDRKPICAVYSQPNAKFIVRACNSHYDLLEALKHAVNWHDQLTPKDIARYKEAIAKAEGKQ